MPEQTTKKFSLDEIRKHTTPSSLWIVIHNHVYDVTKFLDEHPGGEEVLIEVGGGNGSEAFEDVGHSTDARELMKDYHIGEVTEEDRFADQEKTTAYGNPSESSGGFFLNWVLPAAVGIGVAVIYRVFFSGSS